jgi:serine phosphatase RsbU (regulator of sigma subunit)
MPRSKRLVTRAGYLIQGYAIYAAITRTLIWPWMWPEGPALYAGIGALYFTGAWLLNGMLTSELLRKTGMESEQIAARRIQQGLQPEGIEAPRGYGVEAFSQPYRDVGGDYFDLIELPPNRTLVVVADVAGKGMAAALLSANLQALVRTLATIDEDPIRLAMRMNQHLSRYTPDDRFVTAVFIVVDDDTGHVTYVNAGHNAPVLFRAGVSERLEATGIPLGMFAETNYDSRTAVIAPGGGLLVFTDGLSDAIPGDEPEQRICDVLVGSRGRGISDVRALLDPALIDDDVTMLLVTRAESTPSLADSASAPLG